MTLQSFTCKRLHHHPRRGFRLPQRSHLRTLKNFVSEKSGKRWKSGKHLIKSGNQEILRRFIFSCIRACTLFHNDPISKMNLMNPRLKKQSGIGYSTDDDILVKRLLLKFLTSYTWFDHDMLLQSVGNFFNVKFGALINIKDTGVLLWKAVLQTELNFKYPWILEHELSEDTRLFSNVYDVSKTQTPRVENNLY